MSKQELVAKYSDNYLWCELVPHYQENPEEFKDIHGEQSGFPDEITDESIEEFFNDNVEEQSYEQEMHHDDFKISVNEEFRKYIGARCKVHSNNFGWDNDSIHQEFTLEKTDDLIWKVLPETELDCSIYRVKDREYRYDVAHHDGKENYFLVVGG
jgi:hypothetical protein